MSTAGLPPYPSLRSELGHMGIGAGIVFGLLALVATLPHLRGLVGP